MNPSKPDTGVPSGRGPGTPVLAQLPEKFLAENQRIRHQERGELLNLRLQAPGQTHRLQPPGEAWFPKPPVAPVIHVCGLGGKLGPGDFRDLLGSTPRGPISSDLGSLGRLSCPQAPRIKRPTKDSKRKKTSVLFLTRQEQQKSYESCRAGGRDSRPHPHSPGHGYQKTTCPAPSCPHPCPSGAGTALGSSILPAVCPYIRSTLGVNSWFRPLGRFCSLLPFSAEACTQLSPGGNTGGNAFL